VIEVLLSVQLYFHQTKGMARFIIIIHTPLICFDYMLNFRGFGLGRMFIVQIV